MTDSTHIKPLSDRDTKHSVVQSNADNGLYTKPAIPNARATTHPAIATSDHPSSYIPPRAQGTKEARGFATGHGVRRAPTRKAVSGSTGKSTGITIGVPTPKQIAKRIKQAAREARIASVNAYEHGDLSLDVAAVRHNLTHRQFLVWVYDQRRGRYKLDKPLKTEEPKPPRVRDPSDGLLIGAGGQMTDLSVRNATRRLEGRITTLQARMSMPTFSYRKVAIDV